MKQQVIVDAADYVIDCAAQETIKTEFVMILNDTWRKNSERASATGSL